MTDVIQVWVSIKSGDPLTEDELESLEQLGVDQYHHTGTPHDGLELIHCIVSPDVIPMVAEFLAARGQSPEIIRALTKDGEVVDVWPRNDVAYDAFFPEIPVVDDQGNPVSIPIYDEAGEVVGSEPKTRIINRHRFSGWVDEIMG